MFRFVLHSIAFDPPNSIYVKRGSLGEEGWGGEEGKCSLKTKTEFSELYSAASNYFINPLIHFDLFLSISRLTLLLCFYCSSRIGLLLEENNVSRPPLYSMQIFINLQPQEQTFSNSTGTGEFDIALWL